MTRQKSDKRRKSERQKRSARRTVGTSNSAKLNREVLSSTFPTAETPPYRSAPAIAALALLAAVFLWSYWPVFAGLVDHWNRIPDYSHGFLVVPLAMFFLWARRASIPLAGCGIFWAGLTLIVLAAVMRTIGSYYYLDALQGWSIPLWMGGAVWLVFGGRVFVWALPALAFLWFMVPLPYFVESMLAQPLQRISTQMSLFLFQCLQQPAVAEGTTIVIGEFTLEVERACSGLRVFFGVAALAFAYLVLFPRPLWLQLLLVIAILPVTLLANSLRIVATGLMYRTGMDELARHVGHDMAGWFMIPLAAAFFGFTLWYLDRLFPQVEPVDAAVLSRQQARRHPAET